MSLRLKVFGNIIRGLSARYKARKYIGIARLLAFTAMNKMLTQEMDKERFRIIKENINYVELLITDLDIMHMVFFPFSMEFLPYLIGDDDYRLYAITIIREEPLYFGKFKQYTATIDSRNLMDFLTNRKFEDPCVIQIYYDWIEVIKKDLDLMKLQCKNVVEKLIYGNRKV